MSSQNDDDMAAELEAFDKLCDTCANRFSCPQRDFRHRDSLLMDWDYTDGDGHGKV